jgi:hypothetical protein
MKVPSITETAMSHGLITGLLCSVIIYSETALRIPFKPKDFRLVAGRSARKSAARRFITP